MTALASAVPLPEALGETVNLNEVGTSGRNCPVIASKCRRHPSRNDCGLRDIIAEASKDVVDMLPFKNELWVVRLKGKDIRLLLEHSAESLGIGMLRKRAISYMYPGLAFK